MPLRGLASPKVQTVLEKEGTMSEKNHEHDAKPVVRDRHREPDSGGVTPSPNKNTVQQTDPTTRGDGGEPVPHGGHGR